MRESREVVLNMKNAEDKRKRIYDVVDKILNEHEVQNLSGDEEFKCFKCCVNSHKRHLDIDVRTWLDRIDVQCIYPFKVQSNAIALVALYMAMNNYDTLAYTLKLNRFDGKLLVETSIPICPEESIDKATVWGEMHNAIEFALDHYIKLSNYSVGKFPSDDRDKYSWLLLASFDALNGDNIDFSDLHYGTEDFSEDYFWKMKTIRSFSKWIDKTNKWYDDNFPFC